MRDKHTVINPEKLAELTARLELAIHTEKQAQSLCELAEKFAQKYEKGLVEIKKDG